MKLLKPVFKLVLAGVIVGLLLGMAFLWLEFGGVAENMQPHKPEIP